MRKFFKILINLKLLFKLLSAFDLSFAFLDSIFDKISLFIDEETRQFMLKEIEKNMLELRAEQQAEKEANNKEQTPDYIKLLNFL
jgi:hypothetical protein